MSGDIKTLVVGIGNEYRSDDGAGPEVVRRLRGGEAKFFTAIEAGGEGTALMDAWQGWNKVVLVDAVRSGKSPGTLHRIDVNWQEIPDDIFPVSTHAFNLVHAIDIAKILHRLPPIMVFYGIEGRNFDLGKGLSKEVEKTVDELALRLEKELAPGLGGVHHA